MSLSEIVDVTITAETATPTQAGFGTPLLMAYHTEYVDRVREYDSADALLDDGFAATDPVYLMAQAVMAQNPRPESFKVGRRALAPSQTVRLTPTVTTEGFVYRLTIRGLVSEEFEYVVPNAATVASICTALTSLLNASAQPFTATDGTTHVDVAADVAGVLFLYSGMSRELTFLDRTTDPGVATDLAAIRAADDDWYCLLLDSNSEAQINAAAAVIETLQKIFVASTKDTKVLDSVTTTDIASDLNGAAYDRTGLIYSESQDQFAAARWVGRMLPYTPGEATWKFKTLAGLTFDTFNASERAALTAKSCNSYRRANGLNFTTEGVAASGEFLDVMPSIDFLTARMQERTFGVLMNADKVPYTDAGVRVIVGEIRAVLRIGQQIGMLDPETEPTVTVPLVADIDPAERAARRLPDVEFEARLAGAIHKVTVRGRLVV